MRLQSLFDPSQIKHVQLILALVAKLDIFSSSYIQCMILDMVETYLTIEPHLNPLLTALNSITTNSLNLDLQERIKDL